MKYEVWHLTRDAFRRFNEHKFSHEGNGDNADGEDIIWPDDYRQVALVEAEDIEQVYALTNHIESSWYLNPQVIETFLPRNQLRSTSVGDVVKHGDSVWRCADDDWDLLT